LPTFAFLLVCAWIPNLSYDASLERRNFPRFGLKVFPSFCIAQFVSFILLVHLFVLSFYFCWLFSPFFFSFLFLFLFFFFFFWATPANKNYEFIPFGGLFSTLLKIFPHFLSANKNYAVYPFRWPLFPPYWKQTTHFSPANKNYECYPFRWPLFHPTQNNPAFFVCWCCPSPSAIHFSQFIKSHTNTSKKMSKCIPIIKKKIPTNLKQLTLKQLTSVPKSTPFSQLTLGN